MSETSQFTLWWFDEYFLPKKLIIFKDLIIDRRSRYTVVWGFVTSKQEVDDFIKYLRKDKYFQKSTHNTYAYRIKLENGTILEWKNDDWETWAWMCVLRELQRKNAVNLCLVVTRYFWWIYLQTDRFKNVIDCCQEFFKKIE